MVDYNNNSNNDEYASSLYGSNSIYSNNDEMEAPPAKIANLSSKYNMTYENGHRKFGPPANYHGEAPSRGCEVFIGKIPRDCFENDLIPLFESCGAIYEFRLMTDNNNINRGFGFCVYQAKEGAQIAVDKLNNYEIKPGKMLGVCFSVDNCRLFVGGIPKMKSKEEILCEMQRVTNGVVNVIAYPSIANKNKNRGFAFVEYESHKAAAMARRKLMPGKIPLWGQQIAVDWAEPEREVCESIMANVKILYARNLMLTTTEETLREKFLLASGGQPSCIERVKKMKDYAFIHFTDRDYAEQAMNTLTGTEIDGSTIEVTWAKPADKSQAKPNKLQPNLSELSLGDFNAQTECYLDGKTGICYLGPPLNNWTTLLGDISGRPKQIRRNAAGTRSISMQKDKRLATEQLEELSMSMNWGIPQYSTTPIEMDRNGIRTVLYSAEVYLPNVNIKHVTQSLHSTADEAKCAVAELLYKLLKQPPSTYNGFDMRLAGFSPIHMASLINSNPAPTLLNPAHTLLSPAGVNSAHTQAALDPLTLLYYQTIAALAQPNTAVATSNPQNHMSQPVVTSSSQMMPPPPQPPQAAPQHTNYYHPHPSLYNTTTAPPHLISLLDHQTTAAGPPPQHHHHHHLSDPNLTAAAAALLLQQVEHVDNQHLLN